MKLEQLYYFQEAVKYRSISVAAKQNYISQSSFSGAISRLEQELGAPLLKRTNTGVEPTELGRLALEKAEAIFQAQSELVAAAKGQNVAGTVALQCIPGFHHRVLTAVLQALRQTHPWITLSISTGESRKIASSISSGMAAIGIVVKGEFLHAFRELTYTPLFQDEYLLYVGKSSPLWDLDTVTWQQVQAQTHIGFLDEFRQDNGGLMEVFQNQPHPAVAFWTDDLDSMKRMISQSDQVALFPRFMAQGDAYLESGAIRAIPITGHDTSFEVGYLVSPKYHRSPLSEAVIQVLVDTVEQLSRDR